MKIFSIALNSHDHNTYDGLYHMQSERITRLKHNIPHYVDAYPEYSDANKMNLNDNASIQKFYDEHYKDHNETLLAFTLTKHGISYLNNHTIHKNFINFKPKHLWDYVLLENKYYIDHHQSHAAYAYLSSGYKESDILAIDGSGSNYNCIFINKDKNIIDLSKEMKIGKLWNFVAKKLGFGNLGASKVMGLAAYGSYREDIHMILDGYWNNDKQWKQKFKKVQEKQVMQQKIKQSGWKCDVACTLQVATEEKIRDHIYPLKTCDNICVAGGVAYNGYINEMLYENWSSVYVPPAAGDEGQSIGTYMHANYVLNKEIDKPSVYAGKEYNYEDGEKVNLKEVAQAIADGKIVGWFQGKSESGHRALGNRSILADPRNPNIKDIINKEIKLREDFRPFAPSVLEEHYDKWFDTPEPSPHMSRIVEVKKPKDVPGITHVDGTARIQTVNKKQNEKYYDLINEFYKITGVPMLLNTSFNCREPIVETPREAINTFNNTELDMVVINGRCLSKMG